MSIYIGDKEIKNLYIGDSSAKEVYVGDTKVRPIGWSPNSNTVAYYPLNMTYNLTDQKGFGTAHNLTPDGSYSSAVIGGVDCKLFGGGGYAYVSASGFPGGDSPRTVSFWLYDCDSGNGKMFLGYGTPNNNNAFNSWVSPDGNKYHCFTEWSNMRNTSVKVHKSRELITMTYDGTNVKYYVNADLVGTRQLSLNTDVSNGKISIGAFRPLYNDYCNAYFSNLIIENIAWTVTEITAYFNRIKANYGIS